MDGVAVINFNGNLGNYFTEGTAVSNKAAKLNDKKVDPTKNTKKEQLKKSWFGLRPSVQTNENVSLNNETKKSTIDIKGLLNSLGMIPMHFNMDFVLNGKRKIKTVPKVADGARAVNRASEKEIVEMTIPKKEVERRVEVKVPEVKEEVKVDIPKTELFKTPEFAPLTETRTQRLERTGEIPKATTPVINAPDRFVEQEVHTPTINAREHFMEPEVHVEKDFYGNTTPVVNQNRSRVERNVDEYQNREEAVDNSKLELGKVEKDLDRIASINHGVKTSSEELRKAYENCEKSEKAKRAAQLETNRLEAELAMAQKQLDEQNAKQIADLNARTQANQEEVMGYTMHSEDLRKQLEEIRSQLAGGDNTFRR